MLLNKSILIVLFSFVISITSATEFTISSYNCGGLSDHYDYLRACGMQKLMQERYNAEPEEMALNEKIQRLALKMLFNPDGNDKEEWEQKGYQQIFERLTAAPSDLESPNKIWHEKAENTISSYKERPVIIYDEEVKSMLEEHITDLARGAEGDLTETRAIMATRIFHHHLKYDIICLQEADYLNNDMFPSNYEVLLSNSEGLKNGVAWNKDRFELVSFPVDILGKALAVELRDRESGTTILVASGHITGCNPYRVVINSETGKSDSAKGDEELQAVLDLFNQSRADMMIIGMDSNVTSLHPRLNLLKVAGFSMDTENYIDPTCTNPYQVLNTRIDWIALKTRNGMTPAISNIPVLNIGLNSLQTNISDHKPIAAKISY